MTIIFTTNQFDDEESITIATQLNENDRLRAEQEKAFRIREKELCAKYDELMLSRRPAYPTAEHLQSMDRVAQMLEEGTSYGDHLGYATKADVAAGNDLPRGITFTSAARRINFCSLSPYQTGKGSRLWTFTDSEVETFIAELAARGILVVSHWVHDDGAAVVVSPPDQQD